MITALSLATVPRADYSTWKQQSIEWADLLDRLGKPGIKKDSGMYLLGQLNGPRKRNETVVSRSALTLDADRAAPDLLDAVRELFPGGAWAAHTTWSHTAEAPRWRVIVPCSREVNPEEYADLTRVVVDKLGASQFDACSHRPAQAMFWPATQDPDSFKLESSSGVPLDVDQLLTEIAPAVPRFASPVARGSALESDPVRPPAAGRHPYAAAAITAELDRLDQCELLGWAGPPWDATTYEVACSLIEFANSPWSGYSLDEAETDLFERAPTDPDFGPKEHASKWRSALGKVGAKGRPVPVGDAAGDFAASDVFEATPELRHIRQAARARLISPPALLAYVLGRVLLDVPPAVRLPPIIGAPASLNFGVALVGTSGGGKSVTLEASRELFGVCGANQKDAERSLGSGEGLVQSFLRWDPATKANVPITDPRRLLTVDEVDSLGATQNRSGSTIAPVLRSALTGGPLGQENATAERRRHVPGHVYRLVLFVGVQPTRSLTLLRDSDAGTPQRLLWVPVSDPTAPDDSPEWPGPLDWKLPDDLDRAGFINYPEHVGDEVKAKRRETLRGTGNADALEGHRLLLQLKVSTALALLHGETSITDQWWELAGAIVESSMALQRECAKVLSQESERETLAAGRRDGLRQEGARRYLDERVSKAATALWRTVYRHAKPDADTSRKHADDEGCTLRCLTHGVRHSGGREVRNAALDHALSADWVQERDGRWFPGEIQPGGERP